MQRMLHLIALFAFVVASLCSAHAQSPPGVERVRNWLVPFSMALQAKGIVSRDEVIAGLSSSDSDIRRLSAARLAELKDPQAKALITAAFHIEMNDRVKVDFASNLWVLGDTTGQAFLSTQCKSNETKPEIVAAAVRQLSLRGSGASCLDRLTELASSSASIQDRLRALIALREIQPTLSPPEQTRLANFTGSAISDFSEDQETQFASVDLLAMIGGETAKKVLRDAMQGHTNDTLGRYIQQVVDRLELSPPMKSVAQKTKSINGAPETALPALSCSFPCPAAINIGSIHTITLGSITNPTYVVPNLRTGVGIASRMVVSDPTLPDWDGTQVTEVVTQVNSSCNSQINLCGYGSGGPYIWTVGSAGGTDPYDGTIYPAIPNSFYDFHAELNAFDLLGYYGWGSCSTFCSQQYLCNGVAIGGSTFTIDYSLVPGTVNGYSVTLVPVGKSKN